MWAMVIAVTETVAYLVAVVIMITGIYGLPVLVYFAYVLLLMFPAMQLEAQTLIVGCWISCMIAIWLTVKIGQFTNYWTLKESPDGGFRGLFEWLLTVAVIDLLPVLVAGVLVRLGWLLIPTWCPGRDLMYLGLFGLGWLLILIVHLRAYLVYSEKSEDAATRILRGRDKLKGPEEAQEIANRRRRQAEATKQAPTSPDPKVKRKQKP